VLRRIIRRAIRHGYKLGCKRPFFHSSWPVVSCDGRGLSGTGRKPRPKVEQVLKQEEERFAETLEHGMAVLEARCEGGAKQVDGPRGLQAVRHLRLPARPHGRRARERGFTVDEAGFDAAMEPQREQARAAASSRWTVHWIYSGAASTFHGYEQLAVPQAKVLALYKDGASVQSLSAGDPGVVVLDHTPFYAESGGQVGDAGTLTNGSSSKPPNSP
jgi:alanyl-tRNA synthetase